MKKCYCIIPCRAGSKRIPNKNKKFFFGKRFFEIAIETARQSSLFKEIIISTNDKEIYEIACKNQTKAHFRSEANSNDSATTISAIKETIKWLIETKDISAEESKNIVICCLYPCTPFMKPNFLKESFKLIEKNKKKFVYPVNLYSHPFERRMIMEFDNILRYEEPSKVNKKTQECKNFYYDAGQFYWGFINKWLMSSQIHDGAIGYDLSGEILYDIDNEKDLIKAELIYKALYIR